MFILLLFNQKSKEITLQDIMTDQNLEEIESIDPHLESLCKSKILQAKREKDIIGLVPSTTFRVNPDFKEPKSLITLNLP